MRANSWGWEDLQYAAQFQEDMAWVHVEDFIGDSQQKANFTKRKRNAESMIRISPQVHILYIVLSLIGYFPLLYKRPENCTVANVVLVVQPVAQQKIHEVIIGDMLMK